MMDLESTQIPAWEGLHYRRFCVKIVACHKKEVIPVANVPPDLKTKAQRDPNAQVDLIVRLSEDPGKHISDLQSLGWTIRRSFSLTPSVAIHGPASASLVLATQPWVLTIEEDKPVHTM